MSKYTNLDKYLKKKGKTVNTENEVLKEKFKDKELTDKELTDKEIQELTLKMLKDFGYIE